jgi:hypothetical protein
MSFEKQLLKFIDEYNDINDGEKTAREIAAWLLHERSANPQSKRQLIF